MSVNIVQLEQAWLQAEAIADRGKARGIGGMGRGSAPATARSSTPPQMKILLVTAEQLKVRQADAEKKASAAFDLLWQAKGQGQQSVHA